MKHIFVIIALLFVMSGLCFGQTAPPLLMRNPTLSKTQIVFSYAGDLWTVSRDGGEAQRLTTGVGSERNPIFSPDGNWIAFTGEYDGNVDVYLIPATGGIPRRLTYHPGADNVVGWTPDGKNILFTSGRSADNGRTAQLFTVAVNGVFPTMEPLPTGYEGSFSSDGTHLAYVPVARAFQAWKRYRGGQTTPIWIANLADSSVERIPRTDSNDFNPIWIDKTIYFLSDRNGSVTMFSYDIPSKKVTQVIQNTGLDIKSAAAGPDAIVYEQFGSVNLYDLKTGKTKKVNITINADMPGVRAHYEKVAPRIT